ncbi:MAG: formylglycine-generating enzyme family protein, partial [Planctomycetota bacterium]|nr:formylglycine-generating enzyme family protein [Planctomycetota bacterium]
NKDGVWTEIGAPLEVIRDTSHPEPVWKESNSHVFLEDDGTFVLSVRDESNVSISIDGEVAATLENSEKVLRLKAKSVEGRRCDVAFTDQAKHVGKKSVRCVSVQQRKALLKTLDDRLKWNELKSEDQDIVIAAVDVWLGKEFRWIGTNYFKGGGAQHRIGTFKHVQSGIELHLIPGGSFTMGLAEAYVGIVCQVDEYDTGKKMVTEYVSGFRKEPPPTLMREMPAHKVEVKPFLIGAFECSVGQWIKLGGKTALKDPAKPLTKMRFKRIQRLLKREGDLFRFPSEAEWEYSYRAGTSTLFYWGDSPNSKQAWQRENSGKTVHRIDSHQTMRNAFGLADMAGNVWEFCADAFYENYKNAPNDGGIRRKSGDSDKVDVVLRGGSFKNWLGSGRASRRAPAGKLISKPNWGFRVAANLPKFD